MIVEKQHLVRPTTFRDYHQDRVGQLEKLPEPLRQRFLEKEAHLTAQMQTGDELWEWEVRGSGQSPDTFGLAIVRQGQIVMSWDCYGGSPPTQAGPLAAPRSAPTDEGWHRSTLRSFVRTPLRGEGVWKTMLIDPSAVSADPSKPAFMAPPAEAKAYHGFPLVEQTRRNGWCLGLVTDPFEPDCEQGCTVGDGFVEAPDGSRAGIIWERHTKPMFAVVGPPRGLAWGVFHFTVLQPLTCVDDLKAAFAAMLPVLEQLREQDSRRGTF